jgi:hypothetical protein
MGNCTKDQKEQPVLPEFQKYLAEKKRAPVNRLPFLAYWVSRYLRYAVPANFKSLCRKP